MTDNENRNETLPEEESRGASPAGQSPAPAGAKRPVPKVLVGIVAVLAAVALFFANAVEGVKAGIGVVGNGRISAAATAAI